MPAGPVFREVQRFRQPWLVAVLGAGAVFTGWLLVRALMGPTPPESLAMALALVYWAVFGILFPFFFLWVLHLTVEVREDGVYYRFFPFHRSFRRIPLEEIAQCFVRTYSPLWEYGGWGIRYSPRGGRAYTVQGNRGVQLVLRNGDRVLLGSQRAEELASALQAGLARHRGEQGG